MDILELSTGIVLGCFFYHVFLNKLINNPKFQKLKKVGNIFKDDNETK